MLVLLFSIGNFWTITKLTFQYWITKIPIVYESKSEGYVWLTGLTINRILVDEIRYAKYITINFLGVDFTAYSRDGEVIGLELDDEYIPEFSLNEE